MDQNSLLSQLSSKKFKAIPRNSFFWSEIYSSLNYPIIFYREEFINFRLECLVGNEIDCIDLSFGIQLENKIIGIMPIFLIQKGAEKEFSFIENCIYPIKFIPSISSSLKKEILNQIIRAFLIICDSLKIKKPVFIDQLIPNQNLTLFHKILIQYRVNCNVTRELFINLKLDYKDLRKSFRKSYKSLISKGDRFFKGYKLKDKDSSILEEFKKLHYKAAGRKTRSEKSWKLLFDEIFNKKSSFYYCTDKEGLMVGGAIIMQNNFEALYAVAAYDRELFHLPIGHFLQDFIIKDLVKRKIRWYRLGRNFNKLDFDIPSKKEIQISKFKSGFSTDSIANFRFSLS